jgi:3-oxoacyl-[acyl-carrier protein] reductase
MSAMTSSLAGKVAIVTGASKGIGAGIARGLGAAGAHVVVNYASSREGAERVVVDIEAKGGRAIAVQGNVSRPQEVANLFSIAVKDYGKLDILVNNAGIYGFTPVETITAETFYNTYNINVLGALYGVQEAIKAFGPEGGTIINIGSAVSTMDIPQSFVYTSSKYVLDSMTRMFAKELAGKKIRVNSINAGSTETEGTVAAGLASGKAGNFFMSQTPLGRIGTPEDIARVAVFLASEDAAWITGELIAVAGGMR